MAACEAHYRIVRSRNGVFCRNGAGSAFISELVRATLRCATGNEHKGRGEDAYYRRIVRDARPVEFAELRDEWSERLN